MTSTDPKIVLVFTDWYLPGYKAGGPIRSLVNLVNAVPHKFYIVTGNKDHHSDSPYEGVEFDQWITRSPRVQVRYLRDQSIHASQFQALIQEVQPDVVYLNSLFSPKFTLLPMRVLRSMKNPPACIVAPRGMLKLGALSVKGFKKKWFLRIAKWMNWYCNVKWHATNEEEIAEIKHMFGAESKIHLSPNLSAPIPSDKPRPPKKAGELRLVCIARISPEKGILEAIRFLRDAHLKGEISCDFIGTQQNPEYLSQCKAATQEAPHIRFRFPGEIHPDNIQEKLRDYHFFYLTSWGENFGHSISEAMHSGLPVIISDKTPWQNLESMHVGWVKPLDPAPFAEVLKHALDMQQAEYQLWSSGALNYAQRVSADPERIKRASELFIA